MLCMRRHGRSLSWPLYKTEGKFVCSTDPEAQRESGLTRNDHRLLIGALSFKKKLVRDVMTPLRDCFMLASNLRLNFQTMLAIYKSGAHRLLSLQRQYVHGVRRIGPCEAAAS